MAIAYSRSSILASLRNMAGAFLNALQFLTVIPIPAREGDPRAYPLARSAIFFPVVGALLGVLAVTVHHLLTPVLPRSLLVLVILVMWSVLTGGLHDDGLADTFDAFGSKRSREHILRVMKDSRVGAFGILALAFSLLIRWQALTLLPADRTDPALMISQILPRAGIVILAYTAGGATQGLGGTLANSLTGRHTLWTVLVALAITLPFWTWQALLGVTVCIVLVVLLRLYFRSRIGGVTGDCLGASNQLQEIGMLLVLASEA